VSKNVYSFDGKFPATEENWPGKQILFLWIAFVERLSYILLHPGKFRMNGTIQEVIE